MKKIIYFFPVVLVCVLCLGFFSLSQGDPNSDQAPALNSEVTSGNQSDTMPPAGFPYPTLFNFNYQNVAGMNGGSVGAMVLFGKYYFNLWNGTSTYRYNNSGPNGGPGTQIDMVPYVGACRDMATDGRYLYAGNAATTLYKFDTNMTLIWTRTMTGGQTRALCFDPNRKGFWNCAFTGNIFLNDTNGVLKASIPNTLAGKYGMAWDSTSAQDSCFIWVWNQETDQLHNTLEKIYLNGNTGTVKADYLFTLPGSAIGIAGGAEITVMNNKLVVLLNYQNFALVGYRLKDLLVGIEHNTTQVRDFSLNQNYPNPFNPNTKISFTLMKSADVQLDVFDITGSKVATLINGYMDAGDHKIDFSAANLASGTYFYKISSNGYTDTKKMLLVK